MKIALLAATAMVALSPLTFAAAQNQLPTTRIIAPKPVVHPVVPKVTESKVPGTNMLATLNPDAIVDPQAPNVRAKDWNAPGVVNLKYMNDAQFAEFQKIHPTAVMRERCFIGQDPDINIRTQMYQPPGRSSSPCYGGG